MVKFWPWGGDASSTASFEKLLSTLSAKIGATQAKLDRLRADARRTRGAVTLSLTFAWLVYAIILFLVIGWQNAGAAEWTGLAGGPVVLYILRGITTAYFNFRIDSLDARLKEHQQERAKTIKKLKDATKFDSTQQLLEKYGDEKSDKRKGKDNQGSNSQQPGAKGGNMAGRLSLGAPQDGRTHFPPPPTANIQRSPSVPGTPIGRNGPVPATPGSNMATPQQLQERSPTAEFAPNAGALPPPPYSQAQYDTEPRWYDRILDVMLGEDETAAKNKIVLICRKCRLVNGQAPPGTQSLAELGMWKCMSCGAMNGEVDEDKKIISEVLGEDRNRASKARGVSDKEERDAEESSGPTQADMQEQDNGVSSGADVGTSKGRRKKAK